MASMSVHYLLVLTALLMLMKIAEHTPVLAPDLSQCHENNDGTCCPLAPASRPVNCKRFRHSHVPKTLRVRRSAHLLHTSEREQLHQAYRLMKALPDDDPRSLEQQRRLHCAYCTRSVPLPWIDPTTDSTAALLDVHGTWLFLPWHRFFLYFHERILASLVANESFALPYWNWDNQDEATLPGAMPAAYADPGSAAYHVHRNPNHAPPAITNLTRVAGEPDTGIQRNTDTLWNNNLAIVQHALVTGVTTKLQFFGQPLRTGEPPVSDRAAGGKGIVEDTVHDAVHGWVGGDLAGPPTAAGDPIFYAHHANIDRLWEVWKSMRDWRTDIEDPDFLESEFLFYDEQAEPVVVKIGQGLRSKRHLRYIYEQAPNKADHRWMTHVPRTCAPFKSLKERRKWIHTVPEVDPAGYTLFYGSPVSFRMSRPPTRIRADHDDILVMETLMERVQDIAQGWLFVLLLMPADFAQGVSLMSCAEFAGAATDFSLPSASPLPNRSLFRVGLGRKLEQLGAGDLREIVVVLVAGPRQQEGHKPVVVKNLAIIQEPVRI